MGGTNFVFCLVIVFLTGELSGLLEDHCTDLSYYEEIEYITTTKQCCKPKLKQFCEDKSQEVCKDVLEVQCEPLARVECESQTALTNGKKCEVDFKRYDYKDCNKKVTTRVDCRQNSVESCKPKLKIYDDGRAVLTDEITCTSLLYEDCLVVDDAVSGCSRDELHKLCSCAHDYDPVCARGILYDNLCLHECAKKEAECADVQGIPAVGDIAECVADPETKKGLVNRNAIKEFKKTLLDIETELSSLTNSRSRWEGLGYSEDEFKLLNSIVNAKMYLEIECSNEKGKCDVFKINVYIEELKSTFNAVKGTGKVSPGFMQSWETEREKFNVVADVSVKVQEKTALKRPPQENAPYLVTVLLELDGLTVEPLGRSSDSRVLLDSSGADNVSPPACATPFHIKWTDFVEKQTNVVEQTTSCEVKSSVVCKRVSVNKCTTLDWKECSLRPVQECQDVPVSQPSQEKIRYVPATATSTSRHTEIHNRRSTGSVPPEVLRVTQDLPSGGRRLASSDAFHIPDRFGSQNRRPARRRDLDVSHVFSSQSRHGSSGGNPNLTGDIHAEYRPNNGGTHVPISRNPYENRLELSGESSMMFRGSPPSGVMMSRSDQYKASLRQLNPQRMLIQPAKVPKKKSKIAANVKVIIKEAYLNPETEKIVVRRGSAIPFQLEKYLSLPEADNKIRQALGCQVKEGLWLEHIDGTDILVPDVEVLKNKMARLGFFFQHLTLGELVATMLFKSVTAHGIAGLHLLVKRTTPSEKSGSDSEHDSDSFLNVDEDRENITHTPTDGGTNGDVRNVISNSNGNVDERRLAATTNANRETNAISVGGANGDVDFNHNASMQGSSCGIRNRLEDESQVIADLLERNAADILITHFPYEDDSIDSLPEINRVIKDEYEPNYNGNEGMDGHDCNIEHLKPIFVKARGHGGVVQVVARRQDFLNSVFEAYEQLKRNGDLGKIIGIVFENERGRDFGGLSREFITLLIENAKQSEVLGGDEEKGYTFLPKYQLVKEIEAISYFIFKMANCIYPMFPPIVLSIIAQRKLPENQKQWASAFRTYPTVIGSETLYNLKMLDNMGVEKLKTEEPAVYLALKAECGMALGTQHLEAGMEVEVISTIFQYEICSRMLWLLNAIRSGLAQSDFLSFVDDHPSALAIYSIELREFMVTSAEEIMDKCSFAEGNYEDEEDEKKARDYLNKSLKNLEGGVIFENDTGPVKLNIGVFCRYVTGSSNLVAVPSIQVDYTREDGSFFGVATCSKSLNIPLGLEEEVFSQCLFEKMSYSGFTSE